MPKITSKKSEKEEALELIESLTEKLKEAVSAEPKLRQKADALSSTMLKNHDKDSDTAKKMKFAIRVLMIADTLINEEVEIYKTLCVLTACLDVLRELPKED